MFSTVGKVGNFSKYFHLKKPKNCFSLREAFIDKLTNRSFSNDRLQPFSKKWNLAKKAVAQVRIDAVNMKFDWGKLRNTLKFKNRAS